jgi:hypothetical protein
MTTCSKARPQLARTVSVIRMPLPVWNLAVLPDPQCLCEGSLPCNFNYYGRELLARSSANCQLIFRGSPGKSSGPAREST